MTTTNNTELIEIDVDKIRPNPNQPRKHFDETTLKELSDSIKEIGLINPIQVKKISDGKYEVISGERRLKAHQLANIDKIKAIVNNTTEQQNKIHALIENIQREDLSEWEKAEGVKELYNQEKSFRVVGRMIGKSDSYVRSLIHLTLPENKVLSEAVRNKKISLHTFEDINKLLDKKQRNKLLKKVIDENISSVKTREMSYVINSSPKDVSDAMFDNKISVEQAQSIAKVESPKMRERLIKAHRDIRKIDQNVEKALIPKKKDNKLNVVRTKEVIENFRAAALESDKTTKAATKCLMRCKMLLGFMDDKQQAKLKHYQKLYETSLENCLRLSENIISS